MLRSICALWFGLLCATSVGAATLTMESSKLTYTVGETITLTVFGDSEGATTFGTFGRLLYRGDIVDNGTRSQRPGGGGTALGPLNAGDNGVDAYSDAFNRTSINGGALTPGPLSTVTLIATAIGIVDVNWNTNTGSGFELDFFGLTNAPGTSFTIVPEPGTAALLGLGLVALAARRRRARELCIVVLAIGSANAASAATLSVVADKWSYTPGETITLTVFGDAQGASAFGIFGRLLYNGQLVNNGGQSQKLIGQGWSKGVLNANDSNVFGPTTANSEAFDQVNIGGGFQTAANPISTITLIAFTVGIVNVIWDTSTGTGFGLSFFGLTNAPGTSFCIGGEFGNESCPVIPEPATGALVALGLLGLATATRWRRS